MAATRNKRLTALLVILVLVSGIAVWSWYGARERNQEAFNLITKQDLIQQITVAGNVTPFRKTVISPPYNAYVKKIYVKIGDVIKAGDPIISLTQSLRELGEPAFPLRAPFPGVVVQTPKSEGEYVEMNKDGNLLVRIDDMSKLFVKAEIPESDIKQIKKDQPVIVRVNGIPDRQYQGLIRTIALAAKEKPGWNPTGDRVAYDVELEITDKDQRVLPGMSAIVDIIIQKKEKVLAVPLECVRKEGEKYSVILDNGSATEIKVGMQNDRFFEVVSGLKENDKVKTIDFYSLPAEN